MKLISHCHGHIKGDECLKSVAKAIEKAVQRPRDMVARYGGEEFAVILLSTDIDGAQIIAEKIREFIIKLKIKHCNSNVSHCVTICVGASTINPTRHEALEELIKKADNALYKAKESGRNQIVRSEE